MAGDVFQIPAFSDKIIEAHRGFLQGVHTFVGDSPRNHPKTRRDGRVAEGARLESVFRGNSNVGSNPTLSAITFVI